MRSLLVALLWTLPPAWDPGPGTWSQGGAVPSCNASASLTRYRQEQACGECKAKVKPGARFCPECGKPVPQASCAECKKPLKPGAKFCAECGAKVEEKPAPKPPEPPKPADPPKPAEPAKPAPQEPAKPPAAVGQDPNPDAVKETRGAELEKFGLTADQVNRAIERGAAWLAKQYPKDRTLDDEYDYLTAYALIHTAQYHTNARLREKIDAFLRGDVWMKSSHRAYTAGVRACALEATKDPELRALVRECAEYLVEAQGPKGTWTYKADVELTRVERPAQEAPGVSVSGGEPLDEAPKGEALTRRGSAKGANDGDNSVTQFALLGLHAAAKCGFSVPREVWAKALEETRARACKDGGWNYHYAAADGYGSMTCAGICSIALCRAYLGEKDILADDTLQAGLKWLAENFIVHDNPKRARYWPLYYLYSVERVGVLCGTETFGKHPWYPVGAKFLVDSQKPDGSWNVGGGMLKVETSFALLFLTRATAPVRALKRGGKGWLQTHALNESQNFLFILDASGSMREELDGKEKFEIAKDVIEGIVKMLPEGTHVGLRVYGHRYTSLQKEAEEDSELVVPIAPLQPAAFLARVRALRCKGKTPITHSLKEAVGDLSRVPADVDLVTILLTDGGESTRGAKPPEAARALAAARKDMKLHVVGFDINDADWRAQLEETAAAGGGRYFHCLKPDALLGALAMATTGASDYLVRDRDGKDLLKGKLGDRHELPEGKYLFSVEMDGRKEERTVWINTEVVSHVTVNLARFLKKK